MSSAGSESFFQQTRQAKKIMVLDLGFLGDAVHLLPALWMVRQAYPQAELHVTVASHITSLFKCVPWVNQAWGYVRYPRHATLRENWDMIARLRREKFDVVINLNGSDRSSWLTFFSGAPARLGRLPDDGGPWFWKRMYTAWVRYPFGQEPVYVQRCRCLELAGFPARPPEFHAEIDPAGLAAADISLADHGTYFHISPFTTADYKELAPEQLAELIVALTRTFPEKRLVLSCGPGSREQVKMENLLKLLPQKPWRLCVGNLKLEQLAAVIKHGALHFCGDTGTLHLALMAQVPTVAWFWPNPGLPEWISPGQKKYIVMGRNPPGEKNLGHITTESLVQTAQSLLAAP